MNEKIAGSTKGVSLQKIGQDSIVILFPTEGVEYNSYSSQVLGSGVGNCFLIAGKELSKIECYFSRKWDAKTHGHTYKFYFRNLTFSGIRSLNGELEYCYFDNDSNADKATWQRGDDMNEFIEYECAPLQMIDYRSRQYPPSPVTKLNLNFVRNDERS